MEATFTGGVSELARHHTVALARVARGEGLTADDALDAVQDGFHTFLGLPVARQLVDAREDTQALMAVIVRNAARNMRRRHHRARPHDRELELEDPLPSADELVVRAVEHVRLLGCVSRLGEVQRRVVTMRMLEEATSTEVASALEITPGHVAVLLHRAKKELLACLGE